MSVIFGIVNLNQQLVHATWLTRLGCATETFAPDGLSTRAAGTVGMGFQSLHTNQRSTLDSQPACDGLGNMLVFDGRLDNYPDLLRDLGIGEIDIPYSRIALLAFLRWRTDCFRRLNGDWALAVWSQTDQTLYLARDHAGTRTLYFEHTTDRILWSTFLETFFVGQETRKLDQEYAACYLASRPLRDRTPYKSIRSVPPGHYSAISRTGLECRAHWRWMIEDEIHYKADQEYEAHFLDLFSQSVRRRTSPGAPILAELSGGVDSSSIVCMSDQIRRTAGVECPAGLIDTLSFYNDLEPTWDERPYFSLLEGHRGKVGTHVDTSRMQVSFEVTSEQVNVARLPGTDSETLKRELCIKDHLGRNYEVIVSGVGGDELLGGVPSPMPELADLFLSGDLSTFFAHSLDWCLVDRSPLLEMLWEVARFTFQLYRRGKPFPRHVPNWITPSAEQASTSGGQPRIEQDTRIGLWPSTIENGLTWWALLETLPHLFPSQLNRREHRYPYLDRDLVEFLFRVPRSKLLKPGRRRALMRGALKGLVPEEILERKRKAYVVRKQLLSLQMGYMQVHALFQRPLLAELGLVIPAKVLSALRSVSEGREQHLWRPLMRSISFELWLRSLPEYSSRSG